VKFLLGLFDHPLVDEALDQRVRRSQEHLDLSLEVARQSCACSKNEKALLPLSKNLRQIAVIGPNADLARLGDYADVTVESSQYGLLNQIKQLVSPATEWFLRAGGNPRRSGVGQETEVVILALGERREFR